MIKDIVVGRRNIYAISDAYNNSGYVIYVVIITIVVNCVTGNRIVAGIKETYTYVVIGIDYVARDRIATGKI